MGERGMFLNRFGDSRLRGQWKRGFLIFFFPFLSLKEVTNVRGEVYAAQQAFRPQVEEVQELRLLLKKILDIQAGKITYD